MQKSEKNYKVYMHIFPNGKAYIGITRQDPKLRWGGGNGYARNEYMYRAIKKYGWENIEHIVLFDGLSKNDACEIEKELIKKHKTNNKNFGYNIESGGQCSSLAESTKQKLREAHTGKRASEETKDKTSASRKRFLSENPEYYQKNLENIMCAVEKAAELKRKSVIQYDLDGNFLAVWNSTREAERVLGIYHSHIAKCCNKVPKYNTAGGYRWEYADK
jgi:group I intron endonuclease